MRSVSHSSSETRHEACTHSLPPGALHGVQYRTHDTYTCCNSPPPPLLVGFFPLYRPACAQLWAAPRPCPHVPCTHRRHASFQRSRWPSRANARSRCRTSLALTRRALGVQALPQPAVGLRRARAAIVTLRPPTPCVAGNVRAAGRPPLPASPMVPLRASIAAVSVKSVSKSSPSWVTRGDPAVAAYGRRARKPFHLGLRPRRCVFCAAVLSGVRCALGARLRLPRAALHDARAALPPRVSSAAACNVHQQHDHLELCSWCWCNMCKHSSLVWRRLPCAALCHAWKQLSRAVPRLDPPCRVPALGRPPCAGPGCHFP